MLNLLLFSGGLIFSYSAHRSVFYLFPSFLQLQRHKIRSSKFNIHTRHDCSFMPTKFLRSNHCRWLKVSKLALILFDSVLYGTSLKVAFVRSQKRWFADPWFIIFLDQMRLKGFYLVLNHFGYAIAVRNTIRILLSCSSFQAVVHSQEIRKSWWLSLEL